MTIYHNILIAFQKAIKLTKKKLKKFERKNGKKMIRKEKN